MPRYGQCRMLALGLALAVACGCGRPWFESVTFHTPGGGKRSFRPSEAALTEDDELISPRTDDGRAGSTLASRDAAGTAGDASAGGADEHEIIEVLNQLQMLGAIDPEAQQKLLEDLKRAPREHWPLLTQHFRATLAYQRSQNQNGAAQGDTGQAAATEMSGSRPVTDPLTARPLPNEALSEAPRFGAQPGVGSDATGAGPASYPSTSSTIAPHEPLVAQATATAPGAVPPEPLDSAASLDAHAMSTSGAAAGPAETTGARPSHVAQASFESPQAPGDWRQSLAAAIAALERANQSVSADSLDVADQAALRLLYLAAGRRDDALLPIPGIPAAEQDFWSQELYGLAVYLDSHNRPDDGQRAAEAVVHLNGARSKLAEIGSLVVRNLAFCSEVASYGMYTEFEKRQFKPGQEVLLYAEIENFTVHTTPKGYHTALKSSYQIFDSRGARVAEQEFATTEEYCRNPRRDFFIRYYLFMPQVIYDGRYTLQLTLEDTLGQKVGQSSIEFEVKK